MKKISSVSFVVFLTLLFACQTNTPPVANFTFQPEFGNLDSVYQFNAGASFDSDDSIGNLRFRWDWQTDGIWDTEFSSNQMVLHHFRNPGVHTVSLEAIDVSGLAQTFSKEVEVVDARSGSFVDARDQKRYKVVTIGEQIWMADNLHFQMDEGCWELTSFIGYQYAHGMIGAKVGFLYDWTAAMMACPPGWHLPSDAEWGELEKTISVEKENYRINYRNWNFSEIGRKLKYHKHWYNEENGTNEYGFGVVPVGYRNFNGAQARASRLSFFWTSSSTGEFAFNRGFHYASDGISRAQEDKRVGYSVRCIRD